MRIRQTKLRAFGGVQDLSVTFEPGLNVVVGHNESGKTTLFNAIRHGLLTPTDLDKRTLRREMDPFFPRPSGNFAEVVIALEDPETVTVRRRWGADPEEEATLQDGSVVRGAPAVSEVVERILPVSHATFRTVLLADQAQLDQTARLIGETPGARDEAASALRAASLASGGVSPEAFLRLAEQRLEDHAGRWNLETDRPEGDRDHKSPWVKGAGSVVKAFYEKARLEEELRHVLESEAALDDARGRLESSARDLKSLDDFIAANSGHYERLSQARGLHDQIAAKEQAIKALREANRTWPLAVRDQQEAESSLTAVRSGLTALEDALEARRKSEQLHASRDELVRINAAVEQLERARAELESYPPVDAAVLEQLKSVEKDLPHAEARLTTGRLRASIRAATPVQISTTADAGEPEDRDAGPDRQLDVLASRYLLIETPELVIEVESGEERFEELKEAHDRLLATRQQLRSALGCDTASEAQSRGDVRQRLLERISELEREVSRAAGVADLTQALAVRDELAARIGNADDGAAADAPVAPQRSQAELVNEIRETSQKLGALEGRLDQARATLSRLTEHYGDQDKLENLLGEANLQHSALVAQLNGKDVVPAGFAGEGEFLEAYESRVADRESAARAHEDARVEYAELVGGQPEQTSEELIQALDEAAMTFERLRATAHTLSRVCVRAREVIQVLDGSVFDPFVARVTALVAAATGSDYEPAPDNDDPLQPRTFTSSEGRTLPLDLLSQGTRDSLALAVRVALAETALADSSAPFILDDPLVDMDPERRKAGAQLLRNFAEKHQVILMTCHPEHAELFPEACVVQL